MAAMARWYFGPFVGSLPDSPEPEQEPLSLNDVEAQEEKRMHKCNWESHSYEVACWTQRLPTPPRRAYTEDELLAMMDGV